MAAPRSSIAAVVVVVRSTLEEGVGVVAGLHVLASVDMRAVPYQVQATVQHIVEARA